MQLFTIPGRRGAQGVKRAWSVTLALLLVCVVHLPPAQAQGIAAAATRVRIGVVRDGITVVTPTDLLDAEIDPNGVDPRTFALSSLGQPVAIYVTGEDDGHFDSGDRLYFFGEKFRGPEMDQKYTDERVYWLDIGGAAGPRMATADARPQYDRTPPADFATTIRAEESNVWWTHHGLSLAQETQDTWFWKRLQLLSGPSIKASAPYTVPYPSGGVATLRLEEISNAYVWDVNPDHRTTAALNGTPVLDETWDGLQVRKVFNVAVPAGVLTNGVNNLEVSAWSVPGTSIDDIYVNYWELDYRRQFKAWQDQLDFRAEVDGILEYATSGFSSDQAFIWDVTDPAAPVRLTISAGAGVSGVQAPVKIFLPIVTHNGGETQGAFRFRVNTVVGNRYWVQAANGVQAPASVRVRPPTGLRNPSGGADAVIVTSAELRPQAERLADWHRAHGRRALVVDIQDAYDEFNEGIYHPKAVQAMLKWANANWASPAPAYLTLFGDGHWNFKNYNPARYPGGPNHIPPYLAFEDPWQGEVPVDARFADLNDDKLPDIAVGRIAVTTLAEAAVTVDKILAYDENARAADWQKRAIFVADNADSAGDFPKVSDDMIADYTPSDLQVTRVYLDPLPVTTGQIAATRSALQSAWNQGAFMVQYTGHGAANRWTHESILTNTDVMSGTFTNGNRLPVVLTFNCLDGYFANADPALVSIAETMQRAVGGGSIAAISPAGLGTTYEQSVFRQVLLTVMFEENVREIGRALTITKQRFAETYGAHYLTQTMMLFGDPAMQLPAALP